MELAARRCQASRALCKAARRDEVKLIGSPNRPGDSSDAIPRPYFDTPRQLGDQDNSVQTNLDALSDVEFTTAHTGGHQKWFNVRAETSSLVLWLRGFVPGREKEWPVEPYMIEPMTRPGGEGFVPLSSALLWIMTDNGKTKRLLDDSEAWSEAAIRLLASMSTGQVEVIGRSISGGTATAISGSTFSGIAIGFPLHDPSEMLVGDNPWICPTVYIDEEHWRGGVNDQLFVRKAMPADWTHLQVKKEDVLKFFSSSNEPSSAHASADNKAVTNFSGRGKMGRAIEVAITELFPTGIPDGMSSQARNDAIKKRIRATEGVDSVPTDRTIQKCIAKILRR
jgi:hypothetical protein